MKNYPLYSADYYRDFAQMTEGIADKYDGRTAVAWYTRNREEKSATYRQVMEDTEALRETFIRRGLAGKHLAIVGENSYQWLLVYLAAAGCGAVAVCIDTEQSDETILQMLKTADTEAVFAAAAYMELCRSFLDGRGEPVQLTGKSGEAGTVDHWLEEGRKAIEAGQKSPVPSVSPEQTASIVFTSGTTSMSKPVMLSHKAILTNASDAWANVLVGERVFSNLPFYHTYGLTCAVLSVWMRGATLYINGNLKTVMRDLHEAGAHSMLTVPLMLEAIHNQIWLTAEQSGKADGLRKLLKLQKAKRRLGIREPGKALAALREKSVGNLRLIISGGAHMSPEIMEEFDLMGVTILQGYGITECGPLVSVNRNHYYKLDSVGLVLPHCEVRIENGEILVRGDNVMNGYYNSPELTAEAMDGEWFHTGDVGEMDKDGFLYITGRKKNLVVFKNGKKVSPEKLEEMIGKLPLVKDVVVYGAASGASADDVKLAASIYPDPERTAGMDSYEILEELQQGVNEINDSLPFYQQIQMVNIREQEFAKTAMQKIKRHLV